MRRAWIILVVTVCGFNNAGGQIPIRAITPDAQLAHDTFDSTRNFLGPDVDLYRGQTLYVAGLSTRVRPSGYEGFYSRLPERSTDLRAVYERGAEENRANTRYDALAFRYFKVVDVVRSSLAAEPTYQRDIIYLKLVEKGDKPETLYFRYEPRLPHKFPFIVQGYFEKLKQRYVGRQYIVRRVAGLNSLDLPPPPVSIGDTVACKSLFVEDRTFGIAASLKARSQHEIIAEPERLANPLYLYPLEEAAKIAKAYGDEVARDVVRGNVAAGMSADMCRAAWGTPQHVNRIVHRQGAMEQWVYPDGRMLYLENDKLTTFQDTVTAGVGAEPLRTATDTEPAPSGAEKPAEPEAR